MYENIFMYAKRGIASLRCDRQKRKCSGLASKVIPFETKLIDGGEDMTYFCLRQF